jgi:prolyl-tRNA editing enzyme YbaK/EbsC (Cys-tRNA(Pro) deacylase)
MHENCERVAAALRAAGVDAPVEELPESTRTAAEAAQAVGTTVAQIAKSLVFQAGGEPVLVIASGVNRVSLEKLERELGVPIARPDGKAVKEITGFAIGGVPPVAHRTPLRVLIDRDLLQYAEIWAAAGTPRAVFRCSPPDLVRATGGLVADVRE